MKKAFLFILLCIFFTGLAIKTSAQNKMYAGVNASLAAPVIINQNNYGQRELPYDVFLTGNFGVQFGFETSLNSAIQIEINYTNSGQSYAGSYSGGSLKKDVRLQYLHVPVWYKFNFKKDTTALRSGSKWYGAAGLFAGFLLNADMTLSTGNSETDFYSFSFKDNPNVNTADLNRLLPQGGNPDYKEVFNSFDFGVGLALGVDFYLSPKTKLNLELRGLMGVPDINAEEWRLPNRDNEYGASRTFNAGINIGFNFFLN
ncbi:MAG: outer membrane beta-barrel protein [Saprospiraceae bacterium]|nr:outer membrane beta-barrel protein [Saprospiraceae bacterium]